jgi:hypothetical protein
MTETWETTVRTAANTMLRYPDKIPDGLEAELYALMEKLDTAKAEQPEHTGAADDVARIQAPSAAILPPGRG